MGQKRRTNVSRDKDGIKVCDGTPKSPSEVLEPVVYSINSTPEYSQEDKRGSLLIRYLNTVLLKERLLHAETVGYMGNGNKRVYLCKFSENIQNVYGKSCHIYHSYFKASKSKLIGDVFNNEFDSPGNNGLGSIGRNGDFRCQSDSTNSIKSTPANISVDYAHYKKLVNRLTSSENGQSIENQENDSNSYIHDFRYHERINKNYRWLDQDVANYVNTITNPVPPRLWQCLYNKTKKQIFRVCKFLHINLHVAFNSVSLFSSIFCNVTCKTDKQVKSLLNYIFGRVPKDATFMNSLRRNYTKNITDENIAIVASYTSNDIQPSYLCMLYLTAAFCIIISLYQHNTNVRFDLICILYFITFLDTIVCNEESLTKGIKDVRCNFSTGRNICNIASKKDFNGNNSAEEMKYSALDDIYHAESLPCVLTPEEKNELLKRKDAIDDDNFVKSTIYFYTNLIQHKFGVIISELRKGRLLKILDQNLIGSQSSLSHFFLLSAGIGISINRIFRRTDKKPNIPILLLHLLSTSVFLEYTIGNTLFANNSWYTGNRDENDQEQILTITSENHNYTSIEIRNSPESIKAALVLRFCIDVFYFTRSFTDNKFTLSENTIVPDVSNTPNNPDDREILEIMHMYCNTLTNESLLYVRNNYAMIYFIMLQLDWTSHKSGLYAEEDYIRHNELFSTYERYVFTKYGQTLGKILECNSGNKYGKFQLASDELSLMKKFEKHEEFYKKVAISLFSGEEECIDMFKIFFEESLWTDGEMRMDDCCHLEEKSLLHSIHDSISTKLLLRTTYLSYMSILKGNDHEDRYMFSNEVTEIYYPDIRMKYAWNPYDAIYSIEAINTLKELIFRSKLSLLETWNR
ncbi:hypothetical protein BEWA_015980 [Theileria equi strain WA]|uniref:Uncharacterized protein n=1 Tax=Theileria equi strain WA TaxID=1537102 RepID=L1LC59_THEEQ|nr:hypothetical protein BEWA_015980 [Theileria equi strain WA]EKX73037.1 hypothetical protein BEWA_015980 [Theileria equi strain WA]|eukprot:XP_004832489.1 hypothetical protein BEWA_015980 [Theileria equi strain WA]